MIKFTDVDSSLISFTDVDYTLISFADVVAGYDSVFYYIGDSFSVDEQFGFSVFRGDLLGTTDDTSFSVTKRPVDSFSVSTSIDYSFNKFLSESLSSPSEEFRPKLDKFMSSALGSSAIGDFALGA